MFTRFFSTRASNPASVSADSSGLRFGLPSAVWRRPGVSTPDGLTATTGWLSVVGEKMINADGAPGRTPEAQWARRRRSCSSHLSLGKNVSPDGSHDTLNL